MRAFGKWHILRLRAFILLMLIVAAMMPTIASGQGSLETCSEVHFVVTITKNWGLFDAANLNPVVITLPAGITYIAGDSTVTLGTSSPNVYTVPISAGSSNTWNIEALQPDFILPRDESEALTIEFDVGVAANATSGDMAVDVTYTAVGDIFPFSHSEDDIRLDVVTGPLACAIIAPDTVCADVVVNAEVAPVPNATYIWTLTGASLLSGQGTNAITWQSRRYRGRAYDPNRRLQYRSVLYRGHQYHGRPLCWHCRFRFAAREFYLCWQYKHLHRRGVGFPGTVCGWS